MAKSFKSDLQKEDSQLEAIISRRKLCKYQINFIIKTIEEEAYGREHYLYARDLPRRPSFSPMMRL
jgi:hypothetical protein